MPKCLFLESRTVLGPDRKTVEASFAAGVVYDLPEASVDRWVRRGVATDDPVRIAAAEPKPARPAKPPRGGDKPDGESGDKPDGGGGDGLAG